MAKKKALGAGLDALLGGDLSVDIDNPENAETAAKNAGIEGVRNLPLNVLKPNPDQPRGHFDEESLKELAESIRQQGVIQPILAEQSGDGEYLIIAGERRWRAGQIAGLDSVPVLVRDLTVEQKLEIALVENIQREDLSAMEEARAYHHLMDALGLSQQEVADKVGKKRSTVANSLRLLKLPDSMKDAVEQGDVSAGHARALLSVTNPADQELLFNRIVMKNLSVRAAETMATDMNRGHKSSTSAESHGASAVPAAVDPELAALEQKFIEALGTKVALKGSLKKGRMEVSWFNADDLDRIYEILIREN